MYDLIRFFEKHEYAEQFLNGDLYMNSIGHFWKLGTEIQQDFHEGIVETISMEEMKKTYGLDLQSSFGNHILAPLMNRMEAYKYVHVLCCVLHGYDPMTKEVERIHKDMKGFGAFAVRIHNVQTFVDRLFEKLKSDRLYGLMGPVNYHSVVEKAMYQDCFDKLNIHQNEKEWRFALIPDYEKAKELAKADEYGHEPYDEHTIFSIGSIRDIAMEIDVDILFHKPEMLYSGYKPVDKLSVPWKTRKQQLEQIHNELGIGISYDAYPEQYVGWAPREAFRDKVLSLSSGFKPIFVIG